MVEFEYFYKGLCGMARAHIANAMTGHLGAALVAAYFFSEEHPDLDDRVYSAIEQELQRIIGGEEEWFNPQEAGITVSELFAPFPAAASDKQQVGSIAEALSGNVDKTRAAGHNVIFASIAIRALNDHPVYATAPIIDGIRKLIEQFDDKGPGPGYYGKQRGWVPGEDVMLGAENDFPPYEDQRAMVNVVMDELIATAAIRRRGFGGLWHIINHATALTELSRFGYEDLAKRGLAAHHHHVRLWRSLPDVADEFGPVPRAKHEPRTPEFWATGELKRDSARLTHRIKTMYGYFTLQRFVTDRARLEKSEEQFLYLM